MGRLAFIAWRLFFTCGPKSRRPKVPLLSENTNFPRYIAPNFLQYLHKRPEVTSSPHAGASAKAAMTRGHGKAKTMKGI
jgi:hypothetical protein